MSKIKHLIGHYHYESKIRKLKIYIYFQISDNVCFIIYFLSASVSLFERRLVIDDILYHRTAKSDHNK